MEIRKELQTHDVSTQYELLGSRDEIIQCELSPRTKTRDESTQYDPPVEEGKPEELSESLRFEVPRRRSQYSSSSLSSLNKIKGQLEKIWGETFIFNTRQEGLLEMKSRRSNMIKDNHVRDSIKDLNTELRQGNYLDLKTLYLDLQFCTEFTGDAFKDLTETLGTHALDPQTLWFNFHGCSKITNDGVKYLTQYLAKTHPNVEMLSLDFRLCRKISDEAVKDLADVLAENFNHLQKLYLLFNDCKEITNIAVEHLFRQIGRLHNLQVFSLKLCNCDDITDILLDNIVKPIESDFKALKELILDLTGTKVQEEVRVSLQQSLVDKCKVVVS